MHSKRGILKNRLPSITKNKFSIFNLILVTTLFLPNLAWAIPSPDLLINLGASIGQLLGLLAVSFGGMAYSLKKRINASQGKRSPWPLRISLILLAATAAGFALYYGEQTDLENKRLQANLVRSSSEAGKNVGDVSLKTLSFSKQLQHPKGISTEQLAEWLDNEDGLNLIDVREPEEAEFGHIPRAWHRRYPDIQSNRSGLIKENKKTIFICFSGNRSSELVETFATKGVDAYFLIGGNQKWIAEGRSLESEHDREGNLRSLAAYPNDEVLLDTPEVELLLQENAIPIDVRYEEDFESGHIPGAINLPLRKMLSDEMAASFQMLPKNKPYFSPCYDKRSCFYAKILGLRLHRIGLDYRGRYTVPHEYLPPPKSEKAYVKVWEKQQQGDTFFGIIGKPMQAVLFWINNQINNVLLAILLTVVFLRCLFLPFSIKAEIDRLKAKKREPQVAQLKEKLKDEPLRLNRAIQNMSKEDKSSPLFNLIGSLLQLTVFIVLFTVVKEVSEGFSHITLLNLPIAEIDPTYLMPIAVSGLLYLLMHLANPDATKRKRIFYLIFSCIIFLLTFQISVALNVYLIASISLMILHNYLVKLFYCNSSKILGIFNQSRKRKNKYHGVIPLQHLALGAGGGNKAENLAQLIRAGLPVPGGFAVTNELLGSETISDANQNILKRAFDELGAEKVAVRSSGLNEDGDDKSHAGIFESVLNVTWPKFYQALDEVTESFNSARAESYIDEKEVGSIVVQQMVDAEYAGVLFLEHPGTSGSCLIELVSGLGEALVSGEVTPESYQFGRYSNTPMFKGSAPIDLKPLLKMGKQVETYYDNHPQDIEWCYADGQFYLLQSRNITANSRQHSNQKGLVERERFHLCEMFKTQNPNDVVLTQDALCELVPKPTRLTLNLLNRLWGIGGTVNLAYDILGFPYNVEEDSPHYAVTAFGYMYVNQLEKTKRTAKGPSTLAAFQLARAAEKIEQEFKEEFLPTFLQRVSIEKAIDFKRLSLNELVQLCKEWVNRFITQTYLQAEIINIAAEYYTQMAKQELEKHGKSASRYLSQIPETVVSKAMSLLPLIKEGKCDEQMFLEQFGHRCQYDFELAMPCYIEHPEAVAKLINHAQKHVEPKQVELTQFDSKVQKICVERSRKFQSLKEEAKHYTLMEYRLLRPLLLEIGEHLGLPHNGIFYLDFDEINRLREASFVNEVNVLVEHRMKDVGQFDAEIMPVDFTLSNLEKYGLDLNLSVSETEDCRMLSGQRISGYGEVAGRAKIVNSPDEIGLFHKGEILVARTTDPTWTPLFSLANGVITDVGGMLSHAAIVARELNLPGIVDTRNATQLIKTGDLVRLHDDGTVEIDKKTRRNTVRYPLDRDISININENLIDVNIVNISLSGALISIDSDVIKLIDFKAIGSIKLDSEDNNIEFTLAPRDKNHCKLMFLNTLTPSTLQKFRRRSDKRFLVTKNVNIKWDQNTFNVMLLNISCKGALIQLLDDKSSECIDCEVTGNLTLDENYRSIDCIATRRDKDLYALQFSKTISRDRLMKVANG